MNSVASKKRATQQIGPSNTPRAGLPPSLFELRRINSPATLRLIRLWRTRSLCHELIQPLTSCTTFHPLFFTHGFTSCMEFFRMNKYPRAFPTGCMFKFIVKMVVVFSQASFQVACVSDVSFLCTLTF